MADKLIYANALKQALAVLFEEGSFCYVEDIINGQPAVDAEPVRHGRWIDETFKSWGLVHHPFKCNLCGEHAEFSSLYCPNCGAKMDEEEEDEE